jgi:hypothetical protein
MKLGAGGLKCSADGEGCSLGRPRRRLRPKRPDEERARIFDQAKHEALEKAEQAVAELNALGLSYQLVNSPENKAKRPRASRSIKAEVCPICGFQTDPPHDGRSHRSQKKKSAFTAAELKGKGLAKV